MPPLTPIPLPKSSRHNHISRRTPRKFAIRSSSWSAAAGAALDAYIGQIERRDQTATTLAGPAEDIVRTVGALCVRLYAPVPAVAEEVAKDAQAGLDNEVRGGGAPQESRRGRVEGVVEGVDAVLDQPAEALLEVLLPGEDALLLSDHRPTPYAGWPFDAGSRMILSYDERLSRKGQRLTYGVC